MPYRNEGMSEGSARRVDGCEGAIVVYESVPAGEAKIAVDVVGAYDLARVVNPVAGGIVSAWSLNDGEAVSLV